MRRTTTRLAVLVTAAGLAITGLDHPAFADGSALTNPSVAQVKAKLAA